MCGPPKAEALRSPSRYSRTDGPSRFHHALRSSRLTNVLFLARSMCLNLSLGGNQPMPDDATTRNLDPLRAYAGTYYLNTL